MTEKAKVAFEGLSLSMRFVLPLIFGVFLYAYAHDQERMKEDFNALKEGQKAVWLKIDNIQIKENADYADLLKHCCTNKGNVT